MTAGRVVSAVTLGCQPAMEADGVRTQLTKVRGVWRVCLELGTEPQDAVERVVDAAAGAAGFLYELEGACPDHTTPMEYGGVYLESDRAALAELARSGPVVLLARGRDAYLDVLAGLPCTAMAWLESEVGAGRGAVDSAVPAATETGGDFRLEGALA